MIKKFNIPLFSILIFSFIVLSFVAYCLALSLDDGRQMPKILQYVAYTYIVLRFPFWILFLKAQLSFIFLLTGLLLDCAIYALLTERLVFFLGNVIKKVGGKPISQR